MAGGPCFQSGPVEAYAPWSFGHWLAEGCKWFPYGVEEVVEAPLVHGEVVAISAAAVPQPPGQGEAARFCVELKAVPFPERVDDDSAASAQFHAAARQGQQEWF